MQAKRHFICQGCGYDAPRWAGRCPGCGQWDTLRETRLPAVGRGGRAASSVRAEPIPLSEIQMAEEGRLQTGMGEFDRVLGGGVVPGSVILIGGDPGIGKTTLLLQVLPRVGKGALLYVSGEESPRQIKIRGQRVGVNHPSLYILAETRLEAVFECAEAMDPAALVVDSIQTMHTDHLTSAPGSVSQVQDVAYQLMGFAKRTGIPVFIIGHVTKEGMIAGPRLLEHIVDTVLYFEGEKAHAYRMLRAVKNRFGSTNEIGVFEMKDSGLEEVSNPSELFLAERPTRATGSVVISSLEGSRPILVELQALVTATSYAMPRRMANGVDASRVSLLLAVMEKRLGLLLSGQDVFVNVVGGLRIDEPAIDLGIVLSVISSLRDQPIESGTVVFGEVGLGGEVRAISQAHLRLGEAAKLGFRRCILPERNLAKIEPVSGVELVGVREIKDALDQVTAPA